MWINGTAAAGMVLLLELQPQEEEELLVPNFVFALKLEGTVRVRAPDEIAARKVVPAVLLLPGPDEVRMANDANAKFGWDGIITSVNFRVKGDLALARRSRKKVRQWRRATPFHWIKADASTLVDTTSRECR
jgi:hypothetical protein